MIKAVGADGAGRPLLILGLDEENWRRLRNGGDEGLGEPIRFNLAELGLPPMTVVILGGATLASLEAIIGEWFT